jgi:hypothetical protein
VGALAASAGLSDGAPLTAQALVSGFSLVRVGREPAVIDLAQPDGSTSG